MARAENGGVMASISSHKFWFGTYVECGHCGIWFGFLLGIITLKSFYLVKKIFLGPVLFDGPPKPHFGAVFGPPHPCGAHYQNSHRTSITVIRVRVILILL